MQGHALSLLFFSSLAVAEILPDQLGPNHRGTVEAVSLDTNRPIWDEYGVESAERADYGGFHVTGYRFKDSTGAFAAAQWLAANPLGHYVIQCTGKCPNARQLNDWFVAGSPKVSQSGYPVLEHYLPPKGLETGSKRYVLGPASLAQFEPRIPPTAVGFDFSPEAQVAKYRLGRIEQTLVIVSYPTPQMARQQLPAFQAIPGGAAKRDGPLVAVALPSASQPADPAVAGNLLDQIKYQAQVSFHDTPPMVLKPESAAQMLLSIFTLSGIVLAFCVISGLAFAGYRLLRRKFGDSTADEGMVWLRIGNK